MSYVIYNKETTKTLLAPARSVRCYVEYYKTERAAKAALTRLENKGMLGEKCEVNRETFETTRTPYTREDFAIAEINDFRQNIEKKETRTNIISGKEFEVSVNTPYTQTPESETYWSS